MRLHHLSLLVCPKCKTGLSMARETQVQDGQILNGSLDCSNCSTNFPVQNGVPRFVPAANYSASFGFQWNLHAITQYDSHTQLPISRERLFKQTGWPEHLNGQIVLEVGSGSGRFTEVLASTGATIVSVDYSQAVDANATSNLRHENVLIVQASLYDLPLMPQSFDRVMCLGVLQHTPDPAASFAALARYVRAGGHLAVDVYRWRLINWLWPRYWIRALTKRMPSPLLYRLCSAYVRRIWPLTRWIHRLPLGRKINRFILVPDFRDIFPLTEAQLQEWAILDTFDNLSPTFDQPQRLDTVRQWFENAGLVESQIHLGINGIEGRGRRPG